MTIPSTDTSHSRRERHEHLMRARVGVHLLRAWAEFELALSSATNAGVAVEAAKDAALAAMRAAGVTPPENMTDARAVLDAVLEYEDTVHGYCESCDRPKIEADLCTGATSEDDNVWICQECLDADAAYAASLAEMPPTSDGGAS